LQSERGPSSLWPAIWPRFGRFAPKHGPKAGKIVSKLVEFFWSASNSNF